MGVTMEITNVFKTQEDIFQRQLKGEISLAECWQLQKQVLENCKKSLLEQLDEQQDKTAERNEDLVNDKKSVVKNEVENPNHSEHDTKKFDPEIEGIAIKEEISDNTTHIQKGNEVMESVEIIDHIKNKNK